MATNTAQTAADTHGQTTPDNWGGAVTIHHVDRDAFDTDRAYTITKDDIRIGRREIDREDVDNLYYPAETVVGTTDLSDAYHRAQGWVVNKEQGGRHGVPSAHAACVFEVIQPDGDRTFHLVKPIGFSNIGD